MVCDELVNYDGNVTPLLAVRSDSLYYTSTLL